MEQRHDIYAFVHKGLRAWMADVLNAIGRLDLADAEECRAALSALDELLEASRAHLEHEETFIHPALEAAVPGSSARTLSEHAEHRAEIDVIAALAARLAEATSSAQRAEPARALYAQLAAWSAANLQHMALEETENNAVLWAHYSDAQIAGLESRLVASICPDRMLVFLRHMVPAMAPVERVQLLGGMQQALPAPAFGSVLERIRPTLGARDWFKLMLGLGPMPLGA
jgi:hemerythrin-like domain-containing protein